MNWSACHERETTSTRQDSNHPPDLRRTYEERGHILGSLFSYETIRGHELLLLEVPMQSHAEMFSSRAANHFNLAFWAPQFQFHGQFNMPFLKKKGRIFLPQIHYFTILKLLLYFFFFKYNRITIRDLHWIIMFKPEIELSCWQKLRSLAFETHANVFRCVMRGRKLLLLEVQSHAEMIFFAGN